MVDWSIASSACWLSAWFFIAFHALFRLMLATAGEQGALLNLMDLYIRLTLSTLALKKSANAEIG